jgi:HK97 family phage major capsid protein
MQIFKPLVLSAKEKREYTAGGILQAALAHAQNGTRGSIAWDIDQQVRKDHPHLPNNGGMIVPYAGLDSHTSTGGAELVTTARKITFDEILDEISIPRRLGAQLWNDLGAPTGIPVIRSRTTSHWVAENPGSDVTEGDPATGASMLTPKTLQATTSFSRQLATLSNGAAAQILMRDIYESAALALERAILHGTGDNNQPEGLYALAGVSAVAFGGQPTFAKLEEMVEAVTDNCPLIGQLAWTTTPAMAAKLRHIVISELGFAPAWTKSAYDGDLIGYRASVSPLASKTLGNGGDEHAILFGNFRDVIIGVWGPGFELIMDPYAKKKQGMVEVTSNLLCGMAVRNPASFAKATGATI